METYPLFGKGEIRVGEDGTIHIEFNEPMIVQGYGGSEIHASMMVDKLMIQPGRTGKKEDRGVKPPLGREQKPI